MRIKPFELAFFGIVIALAVLFLRAGTVGDVILFLEGHTSRSRAASESAFSDSDYSNLPFEEIAPQLQAKAVYVYDLEEGQPIFAENENTILPLASLTKVMTAVVATETLPQGTIIPITQEALDEQEDNGLLLGEKWRFSDLLNFTLTVSSNDGAHAIAAVAGAATLPRAISTTTNATGVSNFSSEVTEDAADITQFVLMMNQKAKTLGLSSMSFFNTTGLDITDTQSGAYGSAKDMTALFAYVLKNYPDLLQTTTRPTLTVVSLSDKTHTVQNSDEIVDDVPALIASKTGNTDLAGGNLIIAFDAGVAHPIIICVLGSTYDGRFTDVAMLASSTLAYFAQHA